jgi:hypothetical protein
MPVAEFPSPNCHNLLTIDSLKLEVPVKVTLRGAGPVEGEYVKLATGTLEYALIALVSVVVLVNPV